MGFSIQKMAGKKTTFVKRKKGHRKQSVPFFMQTIKIKLQNHSKIV